MSQVQDQAIGLRLPALASRTASPAEAVSGVPWRQRYRMSLLVTDSVIILAAVVISTDWVRSGLWGEAGTADTQLAGFLVAAAWLIMMNVYRARDPMLFGVGASEYKRVIHASAATFGWLAILAVLAGDQDLRNFLLFSLPVGMVSLVGSRWIWRHWLTGQRKFGHYLSKVVVVGSQEDVRYVIAQLDRHTGAVYDVVGAVLDGRRDGPQQLRAGRRTVPVVYGLGKVEGSVARTGADAVIVAGHLRKGSSFIRQLGWRLERTDTELVLASSLTNVAGPRIQMRPVEGLPLMHVEMPQFAGARHVVKRLMDIGFALLALTVLAPILVVIALMVVRDSPGHAVYKQERVGRLSNRFVMYKFRSMVPTAEDELALLQQYNDGSGLLFKLHNDPRVTRVGRWIRKYSLDELPQFYNVLRGDMSLVGPRPPLPNEVSGYEEHTHRRLFIKPGLTGLWQINGRSDLSWEESVRLDLYYVENWSVTGDLMIMWRTLKVMLRPTGAY